MNRFITLKLAGLIALALGLSACQCNAQLQWRLSIKIILDANNQRPIGNLATNSNIQAAIDDANAVLDTFGRGYRYHITEIIDLPGHSALINQECQAASDAIEAGVAINPVSYQWRSDAINVFINRAADDTGSCAFNGLLVINVNGGRGAFLHEGGHHLGLCHTQGCGCKDCTECTTIVDDGIADTLPDRACWNEDAISQYSYGVPYNSLTDPAKQKLVSDTFNNIMAYHRSEGGDQNVLTSDQLDKVADTSNSTRANVTTGFTRFVDRSNTCAPTGSSACSGNLGGPFKTVAAGVSAAVSGDIVLVRPGHYNEPMLITKPLTLRATRGNALIGIP